jgi:hypothetical protein
MGAPQGSSPPACCIQSVSWWSGVFEKCTPISQQLMVPVPQVSVQKQRCSTIPCACACCRLIVAIRVLLAGPGGVVLVFVVWV